MKVLLLANESPADFDLRDKEQEYEGYMGQWYAFGGSLEKAGVFLQGAALAPPSTATVVSVRNGVRNVEDGPYPDTKEQLGGFFIIEVADLTKAADWAAKCPASKSGFVDARVIPNFHEEHAK
ncbi:YciI family protein [Hyphococcus sp.]|uniref:YciI family protein n=1 Tax=Hyphococcus sp. TaxID=2038636 RepID=UPI002087184B|nr:MAG: hypothetical protein DHS20C04_12560 [Marinicaulis sp.]